MRPIALALLVAASVALQLGNHVFEHRTAGFGVPAGSYNISAPMYIIPPDDTGCTLSIFSVLKFMGRIVVVSEDNACSNFELAQNIYDASLGKVYGIVIYQHPGDTLPKENDEIVSPGFPIPIVYVEFDTFSSIVDIRQHDIHANVIGLSTRGDVAYVPSAETTHAPEQPSNQEIEGHKNFWWWFSATTLQDWLFLLFGFLCVILLLLIGLKFYRVCKYRVNNSVVVRNLRVARIERIPTVQYNKSIINESCVVCLEEFDANSAVKVLSCNHGYHPRCIDVWLMQSDKCPLCNADAISQRKRVWDNCCLCWYPNRDDFGFQQMSDEEIEVEMNISVANVDPIEVVDTQYHMFQDENGLINM